MRNLQILNHFQLKTKQQKTLHGKNKHIYKPHSAVGYRFPTSALGNSIHTLQLTPKYVSPVQPTPLGYGFELSKAYVQFPLRSLTGPKVNYDLNPPLNYLSF